HLDTKHEFLPAPCSARWSREPLKSVEFSPHPLAQRGVFAFIDLLINLLRDAKHDVLSQPRILEMDALRRLVPSAHEIDDHIVIQHDGETITGIGPGYESE